MRIYYGGIIMEADTFSPVHATIQTFRDQCWLEGEEELEALRPTTEQCAGALRFFHARRDIEFIPGLYAHAMTSGPIVAGDFEKMTDILLRYLKKAGKVDGVLFSMHGACQSETVDDCEGYILENAREIVGRDIPIVSSFDFHACFTKKMLQNLDGATGFMTFPHTDHDKTCYRAAEALVKLIETGIKPKKFLMNLPFIMPCINAAHEYPLLPVTNMYKKYVRMPELLSGGMFLTQPWLDTPEHGCQTVAFYENDEDREALEKKCYEILNHIWNNRVEFFPRQPDIYEAIEMAKGMEPPAIVVDYGDTPPAGGSGDSTVTIKALLDVNDALAKPACVFVCDPDTLAKAREVGVGNMGRFRIGTTEGTAFNSRIPVDAEVVLINDEPFMNLGRAQEGSLVLTGGRALLRNGNVNIIVCGLVCMTHDRNMLITMGLAPEEMGIVVQKSTQSFKAGWEGVMKSFIQADTPGYSALDLKRYKWERVARPIYPLDEIEHMEIKVYSL